MPPSVVFSLVIFLIALAAGCLPLLMHWSDRTLHLFITLSCGVFLGAVFLHLLPEVAHVAVRAEMQAGNPGGGHTSSHLWLYVLIGVVAIYVLESLLVRDAHTSDEHKHAMVSYAAFLGLCVHSLTEGLGLAATLHDAKLAWPVFMSIVTHKAAEGFSLATVFVLAAFRAKKILGLMTAYALLTPVAVLAGRFFLSGLSEGARGRLMALAAGTFLFVALCELLPEVFHHHSDRLLKVILLLLGIGFIFVIHQVSE